MHKVHTFPAQIPATPPVQRHTPVCSGLLYTLARHGQGLTHEAAVQKLRASLSALNSGPDTSPEAA